MELSSFNFTAAEEVELVRSQFAECHRIFRAAAYDTDQAISCQINDALENASDEHHNCLGCNFAEMIDLIDGFLATHSLLAKVRHAYVTHLLLNYLLVERLDTLFDIVELNSAYRQENFKILRTVRRWANFIKHPKAFLLTHHAEYTFEGSPKLPELSARASVTVDGSFLDAYYVNEAKNGELYRKLENKDSVLVVFPEARVVTTEMCAAMRACVGIVRDNQVYRSVLEKRATFLNYWSGGEKSE